jgi:hypothetical protein
VADGLSLAGVPNWVSVPLSPLLGNFRSTFCLFFSLIQRFKDCLSSI